MNIKGTDLFHKLNIKSENKKNDVDFPFHIGGPLNQIMALFYIRMITKINLQLKCLVTFV